jgi:hypothetical protein
MRVVHSDQMKKSQLHAPRSRRFACTCIILFYPSHLPGRDVMVILSFSCPSCSRHVSSPALPPCLPIPFDCIHHMYTGLVYSDHLRYVAETATCTMPAQYALKLNQCFIPPPPPACTHGTPSCVNSVPALPCTGTTCPLVARAL